MNKFTLYAPKSTEPAEPEVDLSALEAFAAGAKARRGAEGEEPPWAPFDPNEKPRYSVSIRLNDYYLRMLQYLAEVQEISQHKILAKQLIPVLRQMALAEYEARRNKLTALSSGNESS